MPRVRVHNFSISLDGFGTGDGLSLEAPFGHAGHRLHEWMFATRFWDAAGTAGVDNAFAERHEHGIGAEIMGARKFGPPGWQDDPEWRGGSGLSAPGRIRTCDFCLRRAALYPLSYGREPVCSLTLGRDPAA